MAWDTAGTQQRLLEAGVRQFAAHGFAGARMDAIGRDAGVNKERVYQYFGNKRGLFAAVIDDRLTNLLTAAGVPGPGSAGVGEFAGALFDHLAADPALARLLAWESLEFEDEAEEGGTGAPFEPLLSPAELCRAETCEAQIGAVCGALPDLDPERATHLLLSIVALCASWWTLSRVGTMIAPGMTTAARRAALVAQVTALANEAAGSVQDTSVAPPA